MCCCYANTSSVASIVPLDTRKAGRAEKPDEEVKDQTSTGRKRAARMYPITDGMTCEWSGLLFAGGGALPIVGCDGNIIANTKKPIGDTLPGAIHHGPDKSTLNNTPNNVHRICVTCHNRWHTLNDPLYGERPEMGMPHLPLSGVLLPHDSETKASDKQLAWDAQYWRTPEKQRLSLPYRLEEQ